MLVNRFGILRRALSTKIGLKKTTSLAMCLCRLHNFCIDCRLAKEASAEEKLEPLAVDNFEIACGGGIQMDDGGVSTENNQGNIGELLDGSNHFKDVDPNDIRNFINRHVRAAWVTKIPLPRDKMLTCVEDRGLKRPTPKRWKQ
jgi:hypothetical protein